MSASQEFYSFLIKKYPNLQNNSEIPDLQSLVAENLISPFQIDLPSSVLRQAENIVQTLFRLSRKNESQNLLADEMKRRKIFPAKNSAIMMSYDFHLNTENQLKLIEINTNAAFLVLGLELYEQRKIQHDPRYFDIDELKKCIQKELSYQNIKKDKPRVAIIDDQPSQQRLYIEFLVAQEIFRKMGFDCEIMDSASLKINTFDLAYNRDTDFFLDSDRLQFLKKAYEQGQLCLSPHPLEYLRLADKQRMIEWGSPEFQSQLNLSAVERSVLQNHIPKTIDIGNANAEELWSERKNYFFKPKRAFGSKQTYKGSSMSRKAFEGVFSDDFLAQEYIAAPEIQRETSSGPQSFKYDLRCYAYEDQLQMVIARIYQGQVTNLKTPMGGFAPVVFTKSESL